MADSNNLKYPPSPISEREECTECGARLQEHEEYWIGTAKAAVVGVAGLVTTGSVGEIVHVHIQAITHGQPGLGIDLGYVLTGLFGFLGAIIWWAFPKRGKQ